MTKSKDAPKTDQGKIETLIGALTNAIDDFYHSYDEEDDPDGDEIPGWVVHAEQTIADCL